MSHFKEGIWKDHASIESLISFHFLNVYMLLKPLFIFSYFEFNCWFSHKMLLKQVKHISKFSCSPMMFIATFEYMKLSNFLCQNPNKVIHNAPRIIGDPSPCPPLLFNLPNFFHPFIYQLCPSIETYLTY